MLSALIDRAPRLRLPLPGRQRARAVRGRSHEAVHRVHARGGRVPVRRRLPAGDPGVQHRVRARAAHPAAASPAGAPPRPAHPGRRAAGGRGAGRACPPDAIPGTTRAGDDAPARSPCWARRAPIASDSYRLELGKLAPRARLIQQACPLWVPLVEAGELDGPGTDYFLHKYLDPVFATPSRAPTGSCSRARTTRCCCPRSGAWSIGGAGATIEIIAQGRPRRRSPGHLDGAPPGDGDAPRPRWHPALPHHRRSRLVRAHAAALLGHPITVDAVHLPPVR